MHYTVAEKTVKKISLEFMAKQARAILADKYNYHGPICVNHLPKDDELYTVCKADAVIENVIDDTLYYR